MDEQTKAGRVVQMRLVVEAADYERAVAFYRDVLGAPQELVVEGGAELIAAPTVTPWRSLNSRLSAPADLQITVFEELAGTPEP